MRQRVTIEELYQYDELSESAQHEAISQLWDINLHDDWWDWFPDDMRRLGEVSGLGCTYGGEFDLERASYVSLVGFCCQATELIDQAPTVANEFPSTATDVIWPFVHTFTSREVRALRRLEGANYLGALTGHTSKHRRAMHSDVEWFVFPRKDKRYPQILALFAKLDAAWAQLLRDLEHWYLTSMRAEYAYLSSREAIEATIRAHEYEFTVDGKRA